jgi:hypothetical protein
MLIIIGSAWKYFVGGITEPRIWGEFYWPLSIQDGLVSGFMHPARNYETGGQLNV